MFGLIEINPYLSSDWCVDPIGFVGFNLIF